MSNVLILLHLIRAVLGDIICRCLIILNSIRGCCACLLVKAAAVKYFSTNLGRKELSVLGMATLFSFNGAYNLFAGVRRSEF